ncbi:P-loop containing nucleoside triphosphate hydrolase protein [Panaeolus papilionaceus]|nr:P-loop containing nucleoside triphosphate hydrolase protein [Panaeolus papilionaceus]
MRLANLVPEISQDVVNALGDIGIHTDADFLLFHSDFELWKLLPKGTVSLQQLQDLKRRLQPLCSAEAKSGKDLLNIESAPASKPLQLFLGDDQPSLSFAALRPGSIIEISGDRGSGKTALALNLLINALLLTDTHTALWVDTLGDFPMETMLQAATTILDRFQITRAFEVETLYDTIASLSESESWPQIIVIDCITPLFGPLLSPISSQGHAIMTEFLRDLHNFASKSQCFVLVVNDTASKGADRTDRKPALGPSFALMTDTSLWLQKEPIEHPSNQPTYHLQVAKSRCMASGQSVSFAITKGRLHRHKPDGVVTP